MVVGSWLNDGEIINFPDYVEYSKCRKNSPGGGTTFNVKRSTAFTKIENIDLQGQLFEFAGLCFTDFTPHLNIYACFRIQVPSISWIVSGFLINSELRILSSSETSTLTTCCGAAVTRTPVVDLLRDAWNPMDSCHSVTIHLRMLMLIRVTGLN